MHIIVPTDFSERATTAFAFALSFAQQCQGSVLLLHVLPNVGPTLGRVPTDHMKEEMEAEAREGLAAMRAQLDAAGIPHQCQVVHDSGVAEALEHLGATMPGALVVMGTKGASGVQKMLMGSNTVDVINKSSLPVLAVPEQATPGNIKVLVYASDLTQIDQDLEALVPLAQRLDASIKIVHIPAGKFSNEWVAQTREALQTAAGPIPLELVLLEGPDVIDTLEQYQQGHRSELLVMFTHQTSFLEQLFMRSFAREIAWHGKIPLLVVKNR